MLLHISDSKTVEDLQDHFNKCFPYLKIEFYKETDSSVKACDKSNLVGPNTFIGNIRKTSYAATMDIKSWDKTSKVKDEFKNIFGLNIQIFRLQSGEWLPTTYSDELTLRQQYDLSKKFALM